MPTTIHTTIDIDVDANTSALLASWVNGNRSDVINALAADHAGLTAVFLAQGIADGLLKRNDLNIVANMLLDRRIALCQ